MQTPETTLYAKYHDANPFNSNKREKMSEKVTTEYQKYQSQTLSQVEKDYLKEIKSIENLAKEGKAHE